MYERKSRPPEKRKSAKQPRYLPARTEEEEEKQACGLAMDLAIKQLREGTASSQIITFFLKVGSQKEQAELEKTKAEIDYLKAKREATLKAEEQDKKYEEVIRAMSAYAGRDQEWEIVEDDYPEY